jgi:NTE family protein
MSKATIDSSRRAFLRTSATGVAFAAGSPALASDAPSAETVDAVLDIEAQTALASEANWNDGLAHPIPYTPPLGTDADRALVLCGGGEYLVAWYMGYFHALHKSGVDLNLADVIVGTSAGSVAGSVIAGGRLERLTTIFSIFGEFPKLLLYLAPTTTLSESQKRAIDLCLSVHDARPATIQMLGRAGMAARSIPGPNYAKTMRLLLGERNWPSPKMHVTANDCYTGERLIISEQAGVPIFDAASASSSWPGRAGPTWIKDRLCMDGGVCQTSTHCDVVAGAKRALVISLGSGSAADADKGLRLSSLPNTLDQEIKDLEDRGTKTMKIIVGLPPGWSTVNLLDPDVIAPALKYGHERGIEDADKIKAFWS